MQGVCAKLLDLREKIAAKKLARETETVTLCMLIMLIIGLNSLQALHIRPT